MQSYDTLRRKPMRRIEIAGVTLWIRDDTPDFQIAHDCLGKEFEPLQDYVSADYDGLIIDAGGYIGAAALKFAALFPKAHILTLEPAAVNFAVLIRNVASNPNITPVHAALVSNCVTQATLHHRRREPGFTLVTKPADNPEVEQVGAVPVIQIGNILSTAGPRQVELCKLDVEGYEKDLFSQSADTFGQIKHIFAELHDRIVPGCSDAFNAFSAQRTVRRFGGEKYLTSQSEN